MTGLVAAGGLARCKMGAHRVGRPMAVRDKVTQVVATQDEAGRNGVGRGQEIVSRDRCSSSCATVR